MDFKGYSKLSEVVFLYSVIVKTEDVLDCLECCYEELSKQTQTFNFLESLLRT